MKARVLLQRDFTISQIDPRLYGAFLEHLGRAIYTGVYEPGHPKANEHGFREDVLALVRELRPPVVRYPGGNFVSAYNWEDGVGPREERPMRLDLAWRTKESNQVGVNEFADWCKQAGTELMLAVNLGSRGLDAARNFLEYCNHPGGSTWSDLRVSHGWSEPHNVRLWCLGNEMDGPWQVGHKTATEYGRLANETAKAMKAFDAGLELVVCGSSHSEMPSYPAWEAEVLEQCYESIDHISLHMYFRNDEKETLNYLAKTAIMERYIETVGGVIDYIQAKKRSAKKVTICFDEWNVWYHTRDLDRDRMDAWDWPEQPRLLEDIYNFEDVLQVGSILNTLIRQSHRVRIACIAQLVNVDRADHDGTGRACLATDDFLSRTTFASRFGRGTALRLVVDSPTYSAKASPTTPYLDISAVHDASEKRVTLFMVNRHLTEAMEVCDSDWRLRDDRHRRSGAHLPATISTTPIRLDAQNKVAPKARVDALLQDGVLKVTLPPLSYAMVSLGVR